MDHQIPSAVTCTFVFQVFAHIQRYNDPNTQCCDTQTPYQCPCNQNGGGAGRNVLRVRKVQTSTYSYAKKLPCSFDCLLLTKVATDTPLFGGGCANPIISYNGDYFANENGTLRYRCFDPNTYSSYSSTPGKLKSVINRCQASPNSCTLDSSNTVYGPTDTYPTFAQIYPKTTNLYYQWYTQYKSLTFVQGIAVCPATVSIPILGAGSTAPPISLMEASSAPTEYFSGTYSRMQSVSDSVTGSSCPSGTFSGVCDSYYGNEPASTTTFDDSDSLNARKSLAALVSPKPSVSLTVLHPVVNITNWCQ